MFWDPDSQSGQCYIVLCKWKKEIQYGVHKPEVNRDQLISDLLYKIATKFPTATPI